MWKEKCCGLLQSVRKLCREGRLSDALRILETTRQLDTRDYLESCVCLLQSCIHVRALLEGKQAHLCLSRSLVKPNIFMWNTVINMYVKCGNVEDAHDVLDDMITRDVCTWTTVIAGYVQDGNSQKALELFHEMKVEHVIPDKFTFVTILSACAHISAFEHAKMVHANVVRSGCELDVYVGSTLVDMYCKCGQIENGSTLFNRLRARNVVSWSAIIAAYAQHEDRKIAFELFQNMQDIGTKPNSVTFVAVLNACAGPFEIAHGKLVHAKIVKSRCQSDTMVGNTLVDMYAKCGSIEDAFQMFCRLQHGDVVSWNVIISGYEQHGYAFESLHLFRRMQQEGEKPNQVTFVSCLGACIRIAMLENGKHVHSDILRVGYESETVVGNSLMEMYFRCGSIKDAYQVFDNLRARDAVSWNVMLAGCTQREVSRDALVIFHQMQLEGEKANAITFVSLLGTLEFLEQGRLVHAHVSQNGYEFDVFVGNTLADMYCKFGSIDDASHVFDRLSRRDAISWNTIIAGYAHHGHAKKAFILFWQMQHEGIQPTQVTLVSLISVCSVDSILEQGKYAYAYILRSGFRPDEFVGSALIDLYAKCSDISTGQEVFHSLISHDVVSWNAMLAAYAQSGNGIEALNFFSHMQRTGVKPNQVTFVMILGVCSTMAAFNQGKWIHAKMLGTRCQLDTFLGNTILDMYSNCGSIKNAREVFDKLPVSDVMSWSAMVAGYAQHGDGKEALDVFRQMQATGLHPNQITLTSVLTACSYMHMVDEGCHYFGSISGDHFITPVMQHYACLADLISRSGLLNEAEDIIDAVTYGPSREMWASLLGSCRIYGNVRLGEQAIRNIISLR